MHELRDLLRLVRDRWSLVLAVTLLGGILAGLINLALPVTYVATARIFVATPDWNDSTATGSPIAAQRLTSYGDQFSQMRIPSYQRVAVTPTVLGPVIEDLGLEMTPEQLSDQITVRAVADTVMIDIEVANTSGSTAAVISNAVALQLINTIKNLEKPSYNAVSPVQPILVSPAIVPSRPASPDVLVNVGVGISFGFVLGLTFAALRAQRRAGVMNANPNELLGAVTLEEITATGVVDPVGSDTRYLRVALMAALHEKASATVCLAAPRATELTFATAVQLAKAVDEAGSTCVLVLADYSAALDQPSDRGLSEVLAGLSALDEVLPPRGRTPALLVPGSSPTSTTSALTGPAFRRVLTELERRYDVILVVAPAVLESTDAIDLAARTGCCALVCPPHVARLDVEEGERLLRLADTRYLGRVAVISPDAVKLNDLR